MTDASSDRNCTRSLTEAVKDYIHAQPEGALIPIVDLRPLAPRTSLDDALRRLLTAGEIIRVDRGLYAAPLPSGLAQRRATVERLVQAWAALTGQTVVAHGADAAYWFGLIPDPPIRQSFLIAGHGRTLEFGRLPVALEEAPPFWFVLADRPAGALVRALGWAGRERMTLAWEILKVKASGNRQDVSGVLRIGEIDVGRHWAHPPKSAVGLCSVC